VYSWKDYEDEASRVVDLIKRYRKSEGRALLDAACGTGGHLKYLVGGFECTGVDLRREMLAVARKKAPSAKFVRGNMATVRLGRTFDVITCLFSSIGYLKTYRQLARTFHNFSRHLRPGGVAVLEPWMTQRAYLVGRPGLNVYNREKMKIVQVTVAKKTGMVVRMTLHFLVAEGNRPVRYYVDRHDISMFNTGRMLRMMERAGLKAKFLPPHQPFNRGLLVGVKR
jgi:SAM-dependent methyltransferase